jgi:hypothetical protein
MSENQTAAPETSAPAKAALNLPTRKPGLGRKSLKKLHRQKKMMKITGDAEFAKAFFEARSKRAVDKKAAFRKKKKGKK